MRTSTIFMSAGCMFMMIGCTSLNDFNMLPTPQVNAVNLNLSNRQNPIVTISYCITSKLPTEAELKSTDFYFYINDLLVDSSSDNLENIYIPEYGKLCREYQIHPDTTQNAQAASVIYQRMLDRNYRVDASLNFAEKKVAPTSSSMTGVFKSSASGVITDNENK